MALVSSHHAGRMDVKNAIYSCQNSSRSLIQPSAILPCVKEAIPSNFLTVHFDSSFHCSSDGMGWTPIDPQELEQTSELPPLVSLPHHLNVTYMWPKEEKRKTAEENGHVAAKKTSKQITGVSSDGCRTSIKPSSGFAFLAWKKKKKNKKGGGDRFLPNICSAVAVVDNRVPRFSYSNLKN
ncbi:hypothetical protein ACLOJK_039507 [Asimina triloba]